MSSSPQRPGSNSLATSTQSSSISGKAPATSSIYNLVMTPINFITFIFSLVLIDLRYSMQRKHTHSNPPSRLPAWLHTLLYQPYENSRTKATVTADGRWYYHTKQKKLFKMEAAEAFRFRNTMLIVLGLLSVGGVASFWYVVCRVFQQQTPAQSLR